MMTNLSTADREKVHSRRLKLREAILEAGALRSSAQETGASSMAQGSGAGSKAEPWSFCIMTVVAA